jgi:hypothetical protein
VIYSAFGLSLAADWRIPGLLQQVDPSPPDICIQLEPRLAGHDAAAGENLYYRSGDEAPGVPTLQVWTTSAGYRLEYADGTQFILDKAGREVRVFVAAGSTPEDAATYLLGPVLGFAMRLRGITCLHASVMTVGDEAIAIAGPAGAGKSTAAAHFSTMGHAVLSDDVAALAERNGAIHVEPAYPQIRLWPDAVAMLYGAAEALPPLTPTWDKRWLCLSQARAFQQNALPLGAVYVLGDHHDGTEPIIDEVSGSACLLALLANTYVGYLLNPKMRQQEFEMLSRVAATVPVRRVVRPIVAMTPRALCSTILEDCERRAIAGASGVR